MGFSVMWAQNRDGAVRVNDQVVRVNGSLGFDPVVRGSVILTDCGYQPEDAFEVVTVAPDTLAEGLSGVSEYAPRPVWVVGSPELIDAAVVHRECLKIMVCENNNRVIDAKRLHKVLIPAGFKLFVSSDFEEYNMSIKVYTKGDLY